MVITTVSGHSSLDAPVRQGRSKWPFGIQGAALLALNLITLEHTAFCQEFRPQDTRTLTPAAWLSFRPLQVYCLDEAAHHGQLLGYDGCRHIVRSYPNRRQGSHPGLVRCVSFSSKTFVFSVPCLSSLCSCSSQSDALSSGVFTKCEPNRPRTTPLFMHA